MRPTLEAGDWALAARTRRVRVGDVVVIEHPRRPGFELVKRVTATGEASSGAGALRPGEIWIRGDAPGESTDSRSFGPVPSDRVRGRVILVWWPPARWRRV